jgi:hypothetical protein
MARALSGPTIYYAKKRNEEFMVKVLEMDPKDTLYGTIDDILALAREQGGLLIQVKDMGNGFDDEPPYHALFTNIVY